MRSYLCRRCGSRGVHPSIVTQVHTPIVTPSHSTGLSPIRCRTHVQEQAHPGVQYATQVEQWLMEGAYSKVLQASKQLPSDALAALVQQVASIVT